MINPNYFQDCTEMDKGRRDAAWDERDRCKGMPENGRDIIGDLPYDVANEILERWMHEPVSLVTKSYSGQSIAATCFDLAERGEGDVIVEILREALEQAGKSEEAAEEWEFYRGD